MPGSIHITNARIWTGAPQPRLRESWRESVTIRNGRIAGFDGSADPGMQEIDAGGAVVTPGLIDAHMHLVQGARSRTELDLSHVTSRKEFEERIAHRHKELPAGQWLIARGWSSENWGGDDPDKSWLAAAGDRPVVCHRMDLHAALVNDAVIRMCSDLHQPAGGHLVVDEMDQPTGLFIEAAAWKLILPLIPEPDLVDWRRAVLEAAHELAAMGITTVGSMEYGHKVESILAPIAHELPIRVRVMLLDRDWPIDFSFAHAFPQSDKLSIFGFKSFIDGTLGSRTARMLEAYADDPGNRGMLVELAAEGRLNEWAKLVAAEGFAPCMHAIGDEAVRLALDAIDQLDASIHGRARIEHVQQIDPADIPRFKGRVASMQPLHKADDCRYVEKRVGKHRLPGTFAFRSLKEAGAILAFGSDWPVVSPDPIAGMRVAITGKLLDDTIFAPEQNLAANEALTAYTQGAAFALQLEGASELREGAAADLVMFDHDPVDADWLHNPPRVVLTVRDGLVTFDGRENRRGAEEGKRQTA